MLLLTQSQVIVFLAVIKLIVPVISDCTVLIHEPWPMPYLLVPQNSTLKMNCTAADDGNTPFWAIGLHAMPAQARAGDGTIFKDHGFYVLPRIETQGMPPTLRLLINDTTINNQTEIICSDQSVVKLSTTLFIFELNPLTLKVSLEINAALNISWNQKAPVADVEQIFFLTISHGSSSEVITVNRSYYYFTAPEGASPCEVYNFSVTAIYDIDSATYTGDGCSVPSPVLIAMLPSLPNITRLKASLDYSLDKQPLGFDLSVFFEPATDCQKNPITNYTLEINSSLNEEILKLVLPASAEKFTVNGNMSLLENVVYSFRIHVSNTVGTVSTNDRKFYTTDVQVVTATPIEGVNAIIVQCEFIAGSNATGCMVVLNSDKGQKLYNLTRDANTNVATLTVTLEHPQTCYDGVEAFDIESDSSLGSLAIPGQLRNSSQAPCSPPDFSPVKPRPLLATWVIAVIVVLAVIIIAVIIMIIIVCKTKKSQESSTIRSSKSRCLCICRSTSADSDHYMQGQIQLGIVKQTDDGHRKNENAIEKRSSYELTQDDSGKPTTVTAAEGENESADGDTTANIPSGETVAGVKDLENLYSEIASTTRPGKDTTGRGKNENAYSDLTSPREPSDGASLGHSRGGGRGITRVPPQEALYDQPVNTQVRTPGDGADYSRTCHHKQSLSKINGVPSSEGAQYATLDQTKDHYYHVLERDRPPRGVTVVIPGPISPQPSPPDHPDLQPPPPLPGSSLSLNSPLPIYQEITELSSSREAAARSSEDNGASIPNTPLFSSSLPPVQRSLSSVPFTNHGISETPGTPNQWVNSNNSTSVKIGTMV